MTPQQRQQLERLREEQARLAQALQGLDDRVRRFIEGVEQAEEPAPADMVEIARGVVNFDPLPVSPAPQKVAVPPLPPPLPPHREPVHETPSYGPPDERGYREPLTAEVPPPVET